MRQKLEATIGLVLLFLLISSGFPAAAEGGDQFVYLPFIMRSSTWQGVCTEPDACTWQEAGTGSASDGGISNTAGYSALPSVAVAPNGKPYVAWENDFGSSREIYVKKWNGGSNWLEVGPGSASGGGISNNSQDSNNPSLAIAPNGTLYVAWVNNYSISSNTEIYVKKWNGISWIEVGPGSASGHGISNTDHISEEPSIAVAPDGTPYIAWIEHDGIPNVFVKKWNGSSWVEVGSGSASGGGVSNSNIWSFHPAIAIAPDGTPYVAWADGNTSFISEIYVRSWNGSSWVEVGAASASGGGISNNSGYSNGPSLAFNPDGKPYLAWYDTTAGDTEIYVRTWNGANWVEVGAGSASGGGISNNNGNSTRPSLVIDPGGTPYVAWMDDISSEGVYWDIYVKTWNGSNWVEAGDGSATGGGVSDNYGHSQYPSLGVDLDGILYLVWDDNASDDFEIYVKRYSD